MKIIITVLLLLLFQECTNVKAEDTKKLEIGTSESYMYIYEIDSCEYIGYLRGSNIDYLSHKGNCKFCKERRK